MERLSSAFFWERKRSCINEGTSECVHARPTRLRPGIAFGLEVYPAFVETTHTLGARQLDRQTHFEVISSIWQSNALRRGCDAHLCLNEGFTLQISDGPHGVNP